MEGLDLLKIKCISHKEITEDLLNKIVLIKCQHWNYPIEEQLKWLSRNLNSQDKHLLILNHEDKLIAYMNLVNVKIEYETSTEFLLGVGNVCVDIHYIGKKLGQLLMNVCTFYLRSINTTGMLLCKDQLNPFYIKAGWIRYNNKLVINKEVSKNNVFFSDDRFINISEVIIDRAF